MATSVTRKGLVAVSDKVILAARPALELIKHVTTDFSTEKGEKYNTINVKVLSATAADWARGSQNYVTATNKIDHADVALNKHKKSTYGLNDLDCLEDEMDAVWAKLGPKAGQALSKEIVTSVTSLLTAAAADKSVATSIATLADCSAIRSKVEAEGYDPADCTLMLKPDAYDALIALLPNGVVGNGAVIDSGIVGARLGFKGIINAPTCKFAEKGVGFVVPTDAIAIAGRYVKPVQIGGNLIEAGEVIDEETGLVMGQRVVVDPGNGEIYWTLETLFGVALTKQTHGGVANGAPGFLALATA